jgi:two-component system LytT family response regulator
MTKISCIIVDDEDSGRIVMRELLALCAPDVEIRGEADNINDAYKLIREQRPDMVFLDIQMPRGNGFELIRKFQAIDFAVVFTTSFDKYAIEAIKINALDYLLKPVDTDELLAAIEKVKKLTLSKGKDNKKIVIHHKDRVKLINISEVVCFEAENSYTYVYTNDGQKYMPAQLLKGYEQFLETNEDFMRINRGVIINRNYITEYSKGDPCIVFLSNGSSYEISRRKKGELIGKLK